VGNDPHKGKERGMKDTSKVYGLEFEGIDHSDYSKMLYL